MQTLVTHLFYYIELHVEKYSPSWATFKIDEMVAFQICVLTAAFMKRDLSTQVAAIIFLCSPVKGIIEEYCLS